MYLLLFLVNLIWTEKNFKISIEHNRQHLPHAGNYFLAVHYCR